MVLLVALEVRSNATLQRLIEVSRSVMMKSERVWQRNEFGRLM